MFLNCSYQQPSKNSGDAKQDPIQDANDRYLKVFIIHIFHLNHCIIAMMYEWLRFLRRFIDGESYEWVHSLS